MFSFWKANFYFQCFVFNASISYVFSFWFLMFFIIYFRSLMRRKCFFLYHVSNIVNYSILHCIWAELHLHRLWLPTTLEPLQAAPSHDWNDQPSCHIPRQEVRGVRREVRDVRHKRREGIRGARGTWGERHEVQEVRGARCKGARGERGTRGDAQCVRDTSEMHATQDAREMWEVHRRRREEPEDPTRLKRNLPCDARQHPTKSCRRWRPACSWALESRRTTR